MSLLFSFCAHAKVDPTVEPNDNAQERTLFSFPPSNILGILFDDSQKPVCVVLKNTAFSKKADNSLPLCAGEERKKVIDTKFTQTKTAVLSKSMVGLGCFSGVTERFNKALSQAAEKVADEASSNLFIRAWNIVSYETGFFVCKTGSGWVIRSEQDENNTHEVLEGGDGGSDE